MTALSNDEINAITCIPGAMFADAHCYSESAARLKEPRKTTIAAPESETQGVFVRNDYVVLLKGDHVTARLLAQIVYWYQRNEKTGKPKLKKQLEGKFWIAKTAVEWEAEISLTRRQVDRSKSILESMGIISTHASGFAGDRSTFYRLNIAQGSDHLKEVPTAYALVGAYGESAPYAPVGASISTYECTHKHPEVHSNTEDYIQETTNKKLKTYKQASTLATPAKAVETTGTIQAKATPSETPPVEPKEIPDTFMVHYWRMAKTHDMDVLLEACKEAGFIEKHRSMLSDPECSMLERIEIKLAGSGMDDTLETLLVANGKHWDLFIEIVINQTPTDIDPWPNFPNLLFYTKNLHHFFEWAAEQVAKNEAKAEPVIVATVTEKKEPDPVVEAKPEPVIVPTLEDADCLSLDPDQTVIPWTVEQGKAWFAEQVAKKAAEAQTIEQKKSKSKGPAKPFHLFNVA